MDISETYSAGKDVEVFYAMNGPWTSLEGDWIGLFLAENPNDYIAYENVQISNSTLDPCSVIFPGMIDCRKVEVNARKISFC